MPVALWSTAGGDAAGAATAEKAAPSGLERLGAGVHLAMIS